MSNMNPDALARAVADHLLACEPMAATWGIRLEEARKGYARIAMRVRADMLNGHGIAHGGVIFVLADTAFEYACNSRNVTTVAQQASIVFLAAAREGDTLIAEAQEEALSGRSGTYAVRVRKESGGDVAVFHGLSRSTGGAVLP